MIASYTPRWAYKHLRRENKGEKEMKRIVAVFLAVLMMLSLAACGSTADDGKYVVGVCQYMPHDSLDKATKGFEDALLGALGEDRVIVKVQDAGGEISTCSTIVDGFLAEKVDLIMANASPALAAAVSATDEIPVLGTSVTDYAAALGMSEWNGLVGGNVSGTSDLGPLDEQAAIIQELFPDAGTVGLLYCSAEPNSVYQIEIMEDTLTQMGYTCRRFVFNDANDLHSVTQAAVDVADVMYMPTDNLAANYPETIGNVLLPAQIPLVTGEASSCRVAGVATVSIDYYELGYITGQMAAQVLTGEADISQMPIAYAAEATKLYNAGLCEKLGIAVPDGYEPLN